MSLYFFFQSMCKRWKVNLFSQENLCNKKKKKKKKITISIPPPLTKNNTPKIQMESSKKSTPTAQLGVKT